MLKFDTLRTSGLGHVAQLKSGDETLFFIGFPDRDMLEIFMMHLGVECREIGEEIAYLYAVQLKIEI